MTQTKQLEHVRYIAERYKDCKEKGSRNMTPLLLDEFLDRLIRYGSSRARAIEGMPFSLTSVKKYRGNNRDFRDDYEEAIELGLEVLEGEAIRRASEGVSKPIYQQGSKVGTVIEYSDGLLKFILEARHPDYRKVNRISLDDSENSHLTKLSSTLTALLRRDINEAEDEEAQ